jgi:hypothetical protein
LGSGGSLQLTSALTIEARVKTTAVNGGKRIFSNASNPGVSGYEVYGDSGNLLFLQINSGRASSAAISNSNPVHFVGTYNGSTGIIYINAVAGTPQAGLSLSVGSTAMIGALPTSPGSTWPGWIDEVRLSKTVRGVDWILTEYNNQFSPGNIGSPSFIAFGTEI